jgi:hypothetical protein
MILWLKLLAAIHAPAAWNVNDLSILLPLPKAGEESKMLAPSPALLPKPLYDALPNMLMKPDPEAIYNGLLKVVAIRFDSCFQEGEGNPPCRKQIRLVWQPVVTKGGKITTLDGAIHSFYSLDDQTFAAMVEELKTLKLENGPATLGVHPVLAQEGYGAHWEKLKKLVTKYGKNIVRATMMTTNPRGNIWTFSGLDIVNGELRRIAIARTPGATVQSYFAALQNAQGEFRAGMDPVPEGEQAFASLLRNSEEAKTIMTDRSLIEATKSALKVENPRLTNPGTIDCASCHSAHVIPPWTLKNFSFDWNDTFAAELYARLDPAAKNEPANVLRAFGYFQDRPVVSRRIQNEAVEAAAQFNEENP